jgi:hypothetical protein
MKPEYIKRRECLKVLRSFLEDSPSVRKMFNQRFPTFGTFYEQRNVITNFLDAFGKGDYRVAYNQCICILTDDLPLREKEYKR